MAASRTQGPVSTASPVNDGTLVRTASSTVGVAGQRSSVDNIAGWPLKEKLTVALRRTADRLPANMRAEFMGMISPVNIGITVGIFAVWVGSHAVGIGEIVDVVLAVVGGVTIGWSVFGVIRDIRQFAVLTGSAKTNRDLDLAAAHLAAAISVIGVTLLTIILTEGAAKIKARPVRVVPEVLPPAEVVPQAPQRGYQVLTPLDAEIKGDGAMAMAIRRAALDEFYKMHPKLELKGMTMENGEWVRSRPGERRASHIAGTDLTLPVIRRELVPGEVIIMFQRAGGQPGTYLARAGALPERLGMSAEGRILKQYQVIEPLEVMETTASTMKPGAAAGVGGKGGDQQLIMPPNWERSVRPR